MNSLYVAASTGNFLLMSKDNRIIAFTPYAEFATQKTKADWKDAINVKTRSLLSLKLIKIQTPDYDFAANK